MIGFKVNGKTTEPSTETPEMPLLWYLRDIAGFPRHEVRLRHVFVRSSVPFIKTGKRCDPVRSR